MLSSSPESEVYYRYNSLCNLLGSWWSLEKSSSLEQTNQYYSILVWIIFYIIFLWLFNEFSINSKEYKVYLRQYISKKLSFWNALKHGKIF